MHILPVFVLPCWAASRCWTTSVTPTPQRRGRLGLPTKAPRRWMSSVEQDRPVMRLSAPFAAQPKLRRTVADRRIAFDLSAAGRIRARSCRRRSGPGRRIDALFPQRQRLVCSGKPLGKKGWRTLRFSKASFTVEGTPAGWDKIDGIRLSAWRPMGKDVGDTSVRFRRLAAVWHDVAMVVPIRTPSRAEAEVAVAKEASHRLDGHVGRTRAWGRP